jgi:phosphatidate cytidylyltransferase
MKNLFFRVLTAVLLLPMVIVAFYRGGNTLLSLLGIASLIGCLEAAHVIASDNRSKIMAVIFWAGLFLTNLASDMGTAIAFILPMLLAFNISTLFCPKLDNARYEKLSTIFFWCFYICFSLSCFHWLLSSKELGFDIAQSFIIVACVSTWSNDTFAYFGGRLFGKHFLFPRVSGKKTWEGFISGSIFSVITVVLIKLIPEHFGHQWLKISIADILWISIPVIVLSPLGDLIESRLKRLYDKKDSSQILPGHGGLLDRIDSLLLVIPWTALYAFIIRAL